MKRYKLFKFEEKSYFKKWQSFIGSDKKWNYEVNNFKKETIQKLVNEEDLNVNDSIFLRNKENESLTLLEIVDNYKQYKDKIDKGLMNRTISYDFMYSKTRKIVPFYKDI